MELLIVVVIIGVGTGIAMPALRTTLIKESVRNARRIGTTQVGQARGAAASRGCTATVHFANGLGGRIWVTACDSTGGGIDTVGQVQLIDDDVNMFASPDTIQFAPTGMTAQGVWSSIQFDRTGAITTTVKVTPVGGTYWN